MLWNARSLLHRHQILQWYMHKHITEIAFIPENWPQTERYGYHTGKWTQWTGREE
jgi:hypothetical protein